MDNSHKVKLFVADRVAVRYDSLHADTDLVKNLGLVGDDLYEFVEDFADNFQVDVQEFDIRLYGGLDSFNILDFFRRCLWALEVPPLEIKQLVDAVETGRLGIKTIEKNA